MQSSLAERFWSVAREFDDEVTRTGDGHPDPVAVVKHVLRVLDAFDSGAQGTGVTVNTRSFLVLLRQHELAGDLLYASPEQARGETMDERSLVFSVGVLLFEKLTGRHPFGAPDNPRRVARIQKGQMGSGVNYFPIIPTGLRQILMRAMGPFPEERWGTIAELRLKLEEFVARESGGEPPARTPAIQLFPAVPPTRRPLLTVQPRTSVRREDESRTFSEAVTTVSRRPPALAEATPAEGTRIPDAALIAEETRTTAPVKAIAVAGRRGLGPAAPLVWMAVGAALATGVFALYTRLSDPQVTSAHPRGGAIAGAAVEAAPAQAAPAQAAPAQAAVAPAPVAEDKPAAEDKPVEVQPEILPTWKPLPPGAPVATLAPFDARGAGTRALAQARACFPEGTAAFGVGLLFTPADPLSKKIYFSSDDGLTPEQRHCLKQSMLGVTAGAPPSEATIVEYSFRIRGDDLDVKVRK